MGPGTDMAAMPGMAMPDPLSAGAIASAFLMWALMMVAMMLPSALPMILLHAKLSQGRPHATAAFALAYLLVWTAVALVAALAQQALVASGWIGVHDLLLGDARIGGALLIAASLYQLTPIKRLCLERCRSPLSFLMTGWRPGASGALRLGLRHGVYCVGCCWMLMALLFVGGVMNLAWVALLALVVMAEKLLPGGRWAANVVATVAFAAGGAMLLVSLSS
jgi:predicted metal-binding membrane protein